MYTYTKLCVKKNEEEILCEDDRDLELQLLNAVKAMDWKINGGFHRQKWWDLMGFNGI